MYIVRPIDHRLWLPGIRPTSLSAVVPLPSLLLPHALTSEAWRCDKHSLGRWFLQDSATFPVCTPLTLPHTVAASKANYSSATLPEEFSITFPRQKPAGLMAYEVHPRTLGCHAYHMLLLIVWWFPWPMQLAPIVYTLCLYTRQTLMIAIDGRQHDGGPVRDQPSQWRFIGLTTRRAGPYIYVDCYTFQSPVSIVAE